ncbi:MAG: hypothetical protein QGI78_02580 [Phycisphaerales bacterium]|nr:hypothetical protein [Phycisphaerales bacterium]
MEQQTLILLFFVAALFVVAGSPCFATSVVKQGGRVEGEKTKRKQIGERMNIQKSNTDSSTLHSNQEGPRTTGEVSGSVSLTSDGTVWLTVFLDDIALLARVSTMTRTDRALAYQLIIEKLEGPSGIHGGATSGSISLLDEKERMIAFSTKDEATLECLRLIDSIGIELQEETRRSIPVAIRCGWRSPEAAKSMIEEAVALHQSQKDGEK